MKKLIYLLSIILLLLHSCSSGDSSTGADNSTPSNNILLKSATSTQGDVSNFIYNGSKLDKIVNDSGANYTQVTYTGDLITKTEEFNNNKLSSKTIYLYNDTKLAQVNHYGYYYTDPKLDASAFYTYNSNGTVSVSSYLIDSNGKEESSHILFFDSARKMNKIGIDYNVDGIIDGYTYLEYDSKNNPLYNITGVDKMLWIPDYVYPIFYFSIEKNNTTKLQNSNYTNISTYDYNSKGYPTSVSTTNTVGNKYLIYFYY
jgi:hypothetical protein